MIFVGPSLLEPPAREGIGYLPPARRGDVRRAFEQGTSILGLVDGLLVTELAVTPTELREVARRGAIVLGAASLGALRAVECPDAVTGIGEVFEAFRDGVLTDDDEVVGTFAEGYAPVARPLVVLRDLLAQAVRAGEIASAGRDALVEAVRALPFDERTDAAVLALAKDLLGREAQARLAAVLRSRTRDVKQRDVLALIERVGALAEARPRH